MSVTQVGAPGHTTITTTGTLTNAWGTGQTDTAGCLLVAVVVAAAATIAASLPTPTGWTKQKEEDNGTSGGAQVGIFTNTGTGSQTTDQWSASVTVSTGSASIVLYVLTGADTTTPVDTSGVSTATASPITVTSSGNVAASGEFAISGYAGYKSGSGTTDTLTETGTGWTLGAQDSAGANRGHGGSSYNSSPTSGATTSGIGNFTDAVTVLAAAMVVIKPPGSSSSPPWNVPQSRSWIPVVRSAYW